MAAANGNQMLVQILSVLIKFRILGHVQDVHRLIDVLIEHLCPLASRKH